VKKTAGLKRYRAYLVTVERGDCLVRRVAFWPPWVFPCKGFPQGCTVLGLQLLAILGIMVPLPLGMESYLIYPCKRILGWRGTFPADGMTS
jgi:hypothetical protein